MLEFLGFFWFVLFVYYFLTGFLFCFLFRFVCLLFFSGIFVLPDAYFDPTHHKIRSYIYHLGFFTIRSAK